MNVVLVGMRGVGKTTVGRILAGTLRRELVDTDELVAQKAGLSIPEIVARHGWERFREMETEVAREVAGRDNQVIVTGGGVVAREHNVRQLRQNGIVIWLKASPKELVRRIGRDATRPLLAPGRTLPEDIAINLRERVPLYRAAADLVINTENVASEAVAEEIISRLFLRGVSPLAGGSARVCCLIGDPVAQSLSPLVHSAGYDALGLDFVYLAFRVRDIKQAVAMMKSQGIRGASVTIPHKVGVMRYLDSIDEEAREIGAVNTIVNSGGILTGLNTDGAAAVKALEEVVSLAKKKVVIIGAGGAAAAIALGLKKKGVALTVLDRTAAKAAELARRVGAETGGGLDRLPVLSAADILVNATPVGMWPEAERSVVPKELLHNRLTVFDIVYNPRETRLLRDAREKGCAIVYGYTMFLYQAAAQFELFTGRRAPLHVMERALLSALGGGVC